eukprot:CAMPEP_0201720500 /NCGR_PEP_ID=MMETSP0593-20130828/5417_1 /ASSEMBLY_ACC=CAM_ASM_000672 /TAXON_ID=267983 /ORGANISM="Skeletonema japonicum, Strain CCMP2506" /LENGTH=247 /DNA_ID=CAMNT_0048211139 /DNA_START=76 /DNA_END=819 /DNA_ORIENTATION=+
MTAGSRLLHQSLVTVRRMHTTCKSYGVAQSFGTNSMVSSTSQLSTASFYNKYYQSSPAATSIQKVSFSSESSEKPGIFGWVQEKFTQREKDKQAVKLVDQINLMANCPSYTLKMFADEVDEQLSSWKTKIPGMGSTNEIKAAKESQVVVKEMVNQLGSDISAGDLGKLDRKQKLKLSIACEKPLDDINRVLDLFRQMEIMHRILRYRKENGLPLPTDQAGLNMAMQQDGMKVMTNQEKKELRKAYGN